MNQSWIRSVIEIQEYIVLPFLQKKKANNLRI